MEIAGRLWLLKRTAAQCRFLIFGNQRRLVEWWIEKYCYLVETVEFYFLSDDGALERLQSKTVPQAKHIPFNKT